jgi:inosine-uridine nucleoside N-ribohydrolase
MCTHTKYNKNRHSNIFNQSNKRICRWIKSTRLTPFFCLLENAISQINKDKKVSYSLHFLSFTFENKKTMKVLLWFFTWLVILIDGIHTKPISTILDTDIGTDYDDQMALTYILANPTIFDLKLVICSTYNTTARGQIAAKTLALFGRFNVPIAIGQNTGTDSMFEYEWAQNYTLDQFQKDGGTVYENGEEALFMEMQKANLDNIYHFIEISPTTSLGHVLPRLQPETLRYIRLFAMAGSIYRGYGNSSQPSKEYNVYDDIPAAQRVFNASWAYFGLAPVDCTNFMQFNGPAWQAFLPFRNQNTHVQLVIDSYTVWYNNGGKNFGAMQPFSPENGTSTMHDVLAAFLAATYSTVYPMVTQVLPMIVTTDGFTKVNITLGKQVNASVAFLTQDPYTSIQRIGVFVLESIMYS